MQGSLSEIRRIYKNIIYLSTFLFDLEYLVDKVVETSEIIYEDSALFLKLFVQRWFRQNAQVRKSQTVLRENIFRFQDTYHIDL